MKSLEHEAIKIILDNQSEILRALAVLHRNIGDDVSNACSSALNNRAIVSDRWRAINVPDKT